MKIAVMSDIHGFSPSLRAVLADIEREPGVERIIVAGDLCEGGPDPAGVVRLLQERNIEAVYGNTDRDLIAGSRSSDAARWNRDRLGADGLAWLSSLPFEIRVTPPGGSTPQDDVLVVHANPFDVERHVHPDASDRELGELIGNTTAAVIAYGHLHIAYQRDWNGIQLLDVSAVGNPKDGDLRPRWGLCAWDRTTGNWTTRLRHLDYPLEETLSLMEESGMPAWEKAAAKLQRASYQG